MSRYQEIKQMYETEGWPFFTAKHAVNIYGIRSGYKVNQWDDILGIAYIDDMGNEVCIESIGTTKPGLYWLKNKMGSVRGTFVLMKGYFKHCFEVRKHKGEYDALCQIYGYKGFWGIRDDDSDGKFDLDRKLVNDVTGLNAHHGKDKNLVGPYSAACQVRKHDEDHWVMMAIVRKAADYWNSKKFSYALFDLTK